LELPAFDPKRYWQSHHPTFWVKEGKPGYLGVTKHPTGYPLVIPDEWIHLAFALWKGDLPRTSLSFKDGLHDLYQRATQQEGKWQYMPDFWPETGKQTCLWYGAYWTGGSLRPFMVSREWLVPIRVEIVHQVSCTDKQARSLLKWLASHYESGYPTAARWDRAKGEPSRLQPGQVVIKDDGLKAHMAIWMGYGEDQASHNLLIVTSNPRWNPNCRKVQAEELLAMGHSLSRHTGYLAPYLSEEDNLIPTDVALSDLRVEELSKEFQDQYLSEQDLRADWKQRTGRA
jgi:hypothetical protein